MQTGQISLKKKGKKKSELLDDELDLLPVYTKLTNKKRITQSELEDIDSIKEVERALNEFKLNKNEIRVYLYLARFGAHKAQKIAEALGVHRTEGYKILRSLESKGLVSKIMERPMKFVAVSLEKVLNNLIEKRRQKIHQMEQKKAKLLEIWTSLPEEVEVSVEKETFQVLEGKQNIGARLKELMGNSDSSFVMMISDENLIWLYNTPFLDDIKDNGLSVKLLTNYSPTSSYVLEEIDLRDGDFSYMKGESLPGFFINDQGEMILLMTNEKSEIHGMWTNYLTIIQSYNILFDLLWSKNQK